MYDIKQEPSYKRNTLCDGYQYANTIRLTATSLRSHDWKNAARTRGLSRGMRLLKRFLTHRRTGYALQLILRLVPPVIRALLDSGTVITLLTSLTMRLIKTTKDLLNIKNDRPSLISV